MGFDRHHMNQRVELRTISLNQLENMTRADSATKVSRMQTEYPIKRRALLVSSTISIPKAAQDAVVQNLHSSVAKPTDDKP